MEDYSVLLDDTFDFWLKMNNLDEKFSEQYFGIVVFEL